MDFFHDFSRLFSFQTRHEQSGKFSLVNFPVDRHVTRGLGSDFAGCLFLGVLASVDNVVLNLLQPRGIAALNRLSRLRSYCNFFFFVVLTFNEVDDDWRSDARVFDELDRNYPFESWIGA